MQKTLFMLCLTLCFSFISLNSHAEKSTSYGPVTKGMTLWEIASKLRPDESVDLYQVVIALMQANPDAFSNHCNYNTLKLKETLTLPPLEQIQAIPAQEAAVEFKRQATQWKNRKVDKNFICGDLLEPKTVATETTAPVAEAKSDTTSPASPADKPTPPATTPLHEPATTPPPSVAQETVAPPTTTIQPIADVTPAESAKSALPVEFTKLMGIMLSLLGVMLLVVFIYDRLIDTE
ncbi:MAG: FimV/HubP family polar landmark protein [Thiotrichaceae bacterium]